MPTPSERRAPGEPERSDADVFIRSYDAMDVLEAGPGMEELHNHGGDDRATGVAVDLPVTGEVERDFTGTTGFLQRDAHGGIAGLLADVIQGGQTRRA